jgi:hypothetical protein
MLQKGVHVEQGLIWSLVLIRKRYELELHEETKLRLIKGLTAAASNVSKRGLLAALLASKLSKTVS